MNEEHVKTAMDDDKQFQPEAFQNTYRTDCNETEAKRVRRTLTKFFDP